MPYKESPTPSIDAEGGIRTHVNNFFKRKGLPHCFDDVLRLKKMRIGKQPISKQRAADELDISRQALDKWYKKIDSETKMNSELAVQAAKEFN